MRLRFDVVGAGNLRQARKVGEVFRPDAVVLTLLQLQDSGLVAGRELRALLGPDVLLVVHGRISPPNGPAERTSQAEKHGVDLWAAAALEADGIEPLVWGELDKRRRMRASRADPAAPARERTRAADEEPSWSELLAGPASLDTMKKLLRKDLRKR